jgi:hypothetical protein
MFRPLLGHHQVSVTVKVLNLYPTGIHIEYKIETYRVFEIHDFNVNLHLYTSQRTVVFTETINKYFMYTTQQDATHKDYY